MAAAVAPRGEAPCSCTRGWAVRGSRRSASRVGASAAARYVARNASVSRVVRAWRSTAVASRPCSAAVKAVSAQARVSDSRPRSTREASSGARRRASVRRRSTQAGFLPRSFAIADTEYPSSAASENTIRASSMGLAVFEGVLAWRRRAFIAGPSTGSTTTGTSVRPSPLHKARRLKPSRTS